MSTVAEVRMWGRTIGAVSLDAGADIAAFEYDPPFAGSGIEISPLMMPLSKRVYTFPELSRLTFHGLPGLLADSLPDKFGNALIDAWLATQGRSPESFNGVERLCYTGRRGMGALEFVPATGPKVRQATRIQIDKLVDLASEVLTHRNNLQASFGDKSRGRALKDILRVGTSAGGARAKAVIAWNQSTNEVRSGQIPAGKGLEYWLLKFDGVGGNRDKELEDPKGYGLIEYAYAKMATDAGITISKCRLFKENGKHHFMTRRFDRVAGNKLHLQSLCALAHYDFNMPGAYGYEQALMIMRKLKLSKKEQLQLYRRMVFNVIARNQDDHTKNIAFLMDQDGEWTLSPAFDMTYSHNPAGEWTDRHQMTVNGKRDQFTKEDLLSVAASSDLKGAEQVIQKVLEAVKQWPEFAGQAGVDNKRTENITKQHRVYI